MRKVLAAWGLAASLSLVMAGCSNETTVSGGSSPSPTTAPTTPTGALCSGPAVDASQVKLPADFPQPGELTITASTTAGPSQVVDGYWDSDLEEAYEDWHRQLDTAGYTVLFDEIEDDDAEISYKSADGSSTGQIALRADCGTEDRIAVHITNRPA
jgi:hypothetical protein